VDSPTSTPARLRAFRPTLLLLASVCVPLSVAHAAGDAAGPQSEARAYFDKATASFALGHYPVAAENFEKAFELKPDPALLYNAAQAHRLAGNKERAVALYQNYLRLYPKAVRRSEVETRVQELKKAIERDRQLATSPPITTMPSTIPPGPPAADPTTTPTASSPPAPPVVVGSAPRAVSDATASRALPQAVDTKPSAPVLVARPEPASTEKRSLLQKPLFWGVVGGAVAAAVVVVLIVALGGPKDPSPSLGTVK
jgi:tetratricopeptide (TPR) repeat protein